MFSVLVVREEVAATGISSSLLLIVVNSRRGGVFSDPTSRDCIAPNGRGHVVSCSEAPDDTPGSDEGVDMVGCRAGKGGTTFRLPCLLPARLLSDGCRLLLAVDGREESSVPGRILVLDAPTEAERFLSCPNDLRLCTSEIRPLALFFDDSFFFALLDGKGGNAQS